MSPRQTPWSNPFDRPPKDKVTRGTGGAGDIGPPKSAAARRTISIPKELDGLSVHMKALELTGTDPEELLFPNAEEKPLDYSN